MSKDLVSQVKKEIEQEKIAHQKALIRKMLSLIEAKEKEIADKKAELVALNEQLKGLKDDLKKGDYSEAEPTEWWWSGNVSLISGYFGWNSDETTLHLN